MHARTPYADDLGARGSHKTSTGTERGSCRLIEHEKEGEWGYEMTELSGKIDFGTKPCASRRYE